MIRTHLLAVLVLVAALLGGVGVASAQLDDDSSFVTTVDKATGLTDDATIEEFEQQGSVTAQVDGLDMTVGVHTDKRDAVGDGLGPGVAKTYITINYDEEIARTIRVYIPAEYVTPRVRQDIDAVAGDATAVYEPVDGEQYMAVTVYVDGRTDAAFPVNTAFGAYIDTSGSVYGWVENTTGLPVPQLGTEGSRQWQYPPEYALSGTNATYHIPMDGDTHDLANMTIQYDKSAGDDEPEWLTVPACEQSTEPVCVTDRNGTAVLFAPNSGAPPVRYKYGTDRLSQTKGALNELTNAWGGLIDRMGGLVGGLAP